jgi:predicted unusual protein kinase regulating ubiquinone biosynthesis (AarF/ABC1/UbiB family)/CBS domain-containing protein
MQLGEVMRREVLTLDLDATLVEAARQLRECGCDAAVAVDASGEPAGILTERDILSAIVDGVDPSTTRVRERMTGRPKTLPPTATDEDASELMAKHGFRHVPVVDGGQVVGIFSMRDRARYFDEEAHRRPATDFGATGVVSHFRGPYHDGAPAKDLELEVPPLSKFGMAELFRMVVVYVVLSLAIAKRLAGWVLHPRRSTPFDAFSGGSVDGFMKLGPTFVKLGQLIASSPGIFPKPLATACLRCLDDVPPFPGTEAAKMIATDLGRPPARIFKTFDEAPLSAASIGQVHACVLPDGREAVIKLQRPNIRKTMTTDLRIMYRLAKLLDRYAAFARNANVIATVEDLHQVTFQELNPAVEADRQDKFRRNIWAFGDNKMVTAPEIYWNFCGPHMICMERMSGVPMDQFDAIREMGVDGELVLRRGAKTWLEAVMVHGPFHGDMHAGNLWVLDDGRSSYLDFGIMGEMDDTWKGVVKDLFYTIMIDQNWARVAKAYKSVGIMDESMGTDEEIGMRLGMIIGPILASNLGDLNIGELVNMSVQMAEQYGTKAPPELVLFGKQVLYMERYLKGLAPNYRMLNDPYLVKNIFPDASAKKAVELGIDMDD